MTSDLRVEIAAVRAGEDPSIVVYQVELVQDGMWRETFGSVIELRAFLRGVQAAYGVVGGSVDMPEVPVGPGATTVAVIRSPEAVKLAAASWFG
jgi:hypothetical protein